ncbi:MAG: hypothetical protein QY323_05005 [Patescibacteria group bacterium]|nr:MAG: hypothetical protein QY323_05005 [Patescibacteria group bacterium]
MMTFSPVRLHEIRDAVVAGVGREVENIARAFGPLREPFDGFVALVPIEATDDPGTFGVAVETCGFRHTQHLSIEAFRAAGVPTEGLPACGVYIAAPFTQPA